MGFNIVPVESWVETILSDLKNVFVKFAPDSWRVFIKRILIVFGVHFETVD